VSCVPALDSPTPSGLIGLLRSWLRARSSEIWQLSEVLPIDTRGPNELHNGSVRVLVVDDNPVNLMLISSLLASRGLVPVLAQDGAEAVTLADELHFDLVLMDLQMPVLDGLTATSEIRRCETNTSRSAVPVVAYFSKSPGAGVLAAHGLNGHVSKPCGDQELEDCLVQWCPAYRPGQTLRGAAQDNRSWNAASRRPGTYSASLR
jgi:CheY-like chemotaxis protein